MDAETFLGAILIAAWAAVVVRGLEQTAVAARKGRKWERAFEPIKLKSLPGVSPPFPSEICSIQTAKDFVDAHIDAPKRNTLHWHLAIGALNGGEGSYANAQLVMRNALAEEGWLDD